MALRLSDILHRAVDNDPVIAGVTADSRKVKPGFLFAALPGAAADGRAFIPKAVQAGAAAVLAPLETPSADVPVIPAHDVKRAYALAARAFWGKEPATVVAVTGTNGKTSVATFCRQIFASCGRKSASLGTLGLQLEGEDLTPPGLTTPDAADVARFAAELAQRGVTHLALEASSHGLDQRRLDGLTLKAAGFLNLTQDHLDYHGDMAAYRKAKLRLFDTLLPRGATAVLNADSDAFGAFAASSVMHGQSIMSVGESGVGIRLLSRTAEPSGQRLRLLVDGREHDVLLPLAGAFQASNVLVAAGLCIAAGEAVDAVMGALEHIRGAPGRLQRVGAGASGGEAYVDYAHTPDGLETVLKALRPHATGRLIVVFGAGGDRDRAKRPLMGRAAATLADIAIVTDDNPRSEDPAEIRREVLAGAPNALELGDRRAAIRAAASQLHAGDVLVVAGKGHEQGQMIAGVNHPFDDVTETRAALEAAGVEPLWTSAEIAAATGGRVEGAPFDVYGVSIDSRTVEPGDLFVALAGERDGHGFVDQAMAKGAAAALVTRTITGPDIQVQDTFHALQRLAEAARDRAPLARRAAVTGSVGKTSVTQAIAASLKLAGPSHNSVKSYNNHIGVPLTLARMLRETERAVFEIGMNHANEITPLSQMVRPHVAVVTIVGPVHVENFPDGEIGVARAKAEIFDGLEGGGVAILNADDKWFELLSDAARAHGAEVRTFGEAEGSTARLIGFEAGEGGATVVAELDGRSLRFPLAQTGAHWGPNALATILAVEALGAPVEAALEALAGFAPLTGRGAETRLQLAAGEIVLIDESYNANPVSMRAALQTLGARPRGGKAGARRKIAVLTDMLELGADSAKVHAALAEPVIAAGVDQLYAAGPDMKALIDALPPARRGGWAKTAAELASQVVDALQDGDVVMVKGSNGSRASAVVEAVVAAGKAR